MENWLTAYHAPFQRFFQRLLPLSPAKWGARAEIGPVHKKGVIEMHSHSTNQDLLACAFGALTFASLALGAALFPLFAA